MTAARTLRMPETLSQTFKRIAYDSSQVDVQVTPEQLAAAAVNLGYRCDDYPHDTPAARRALTAVIAAYWQPDLHAVADDVQAEGWILAGSETWRTQRLSLAARAAGGCAYDHGPGAWSYKGGYCKTCRAIARAKERAAKREQESDTRA